MFRIGQVISNVLPFLLVLLYIGFIFFVRGKIQDPKELLETIVSLYGIHGYYLVFVGGLLEGSFLIGLYVPGSTVILLGAALSQTGILSFPLVLFLGTLGLCLGYAMSYIFGRFGWMHILSKIGMQDGIAKAQEKIQQYQITSFLIGYFSPASASFLATASGVIKMPFGKFLWWTLLSQGIWSMIWGSLAYLIGLRLVELLMQYFIYVVIALGIIWAVKRVVRKRKVISDKQ